MKMFSTDEEQLKDKIEYQLDLIQFLDLLRLDFRDVIELIFAAGIDEERYTQLERTVR